MPRGVRCACCGLPAAQEESCVVCEAPRVQHDEVVEPALYGEPLALVIQALLYVIRGQVALGQAIVVAWRTRGSAGLRAVDFEAIAEITGEPMGPAGKPLSNAQAAVSAWLLGDDGNGHIPASYALLYERYFVESCFDDPEGLSYLGLLEATGIRGHNRELSHRPDEASSRRLIRHARRDLELLAALEARSAGKPPEAEAVSVGVLRWTLEMDVDAEPFIHHGYAVDQMDGPHVTLQLWMTDITPVRCLEDGWNYVARLRAFAPRLGLVSKELALQRSIGIVPPRFVLDKVLGTVRKVRNAASPRRRAARAPPARLPRGRSAARRCTPRRATRPRRPHCTPRSPSGSRRRSATASAFPTRSATRRAMRSAARWRQGMRRS